MYNKFTLLTKYIKYQLTAGNGKGHGIHSPFLYDFIRNVLNDRSVFVYYETIESVRQRLLTDDRVIEVSDLGAGSSVIQSKMRKVKDIAASSPKNKKFAQLLFRIVRYYKPDTVIELGTSLGITSCYLAAANPYDKVYTIEGSENLAKIAKESLHSINAFNIDVITGNFDQQLPELLSKLKRTGLVFVDGNHRLDPTLRYFYMLMEKVDEKSILIFDDIHWSREMESAWEQIKQHPGVILTVDLFFIGIVFFNKDIKAKQHFTLRF